MGGIADTPSKVGKRPAMKQLQWLVVGVIFILFSGITWGNNYIHVGEVRGLDVQVEFLDYADVTHSGEFQYSMEQSMWYRIMLINRSNQSFSGLEIQSSLHSDGAECGDLSLFPGARLPGMALSPIKRTSLSPGARTDYETLYDVPSNLCPSSGHLKVRVQYSQAGRVNSSTLIAPVHYRFE